MKTKYALIAVFLFTYFGGFSQKGVINKGAKIIITSNAYLNIDGGVNADYTNQSYDASSHGRIDLQGIIKIEGDWENQATSGNVFINTATDGEIKFDGISQQTIGGAYSTFFEKFTLNNPGGVLLNTSTSVKGTLTLTSGLLKLSTNNLFLDANTSIAGSPSSLSMILPNSTGSVYKYLTSAGTFTFPVGDTLSTDEYSPFMVNFASGAFGSGAYVKLNVVNQKHPNNTSSSTYLTRYWSVTPFNITNYIVGVEGYYANGDVVGTEGNIFMSRYSSPYWDKLDVANTTLNKLTGAGLTSLSDFTGAESASVTPAIALSYDGLISEGNENNEIITITLTNDDFAASLNTANWTVTNLPQGVSKGTLIRTGNKTATLTLSGNRTLDFDSNISNIAVSIAAAEFTHLSSGSLIATSGVLITASNDSESITMTDDGLITEVSEDGEIITVTAVGGTFASSITPANWTLTNLPTGVSKGTVTRINATTVKIALSGNRTLDYDTDITNAMLTITDTEIDEYTGANLSVNSGVKFTAIDESLTITMASDGLISEGSETGEIITINLTGRDFAASLNTANWIVTNLPEGVTKGTLTRVNNTQATIALSGNRSKDYDANITNMSIQIASGEIVSYMPIAYVTSGVTFTANLDAETIALADNGISEGFENGKKITVTLSGGSYANSLSLTNWSVTNLPAGVTIGAINRVSSTVAELTLSGNRVRDYDSNISNVTVSIAQEEIDDHTGSNITANTGVTFVATNDGETLTMIGDGSITEGHEDSEVITITLSGGTIIDPITPANWVLTNLPIGVSANAAVRMSATSASITLTGNATQDYDANITNATLSVSAGQIYDNLGSSMIVNSGVTFIATDEPVSIALTDNGITEGSEDGKIITVILAQDSFKPSLTDNNWTLINLPSGVTKGALARVSNTVATITLLGNRNQDYDTDISNVQLTIDGAELTQHTASPISQNTGLLFDAIEDIELITMDDDGQILEGSEGGEVITVTLSGGTFGNINLSNWSMSNLPNGVTIGSLTKIDNSTVSLTLAGNSALDYDTDITNCILSVDEADIDDYSGTSLTVNSGIIFTAILESITIAMSDDGSLNESYENGEVITVNISEDTFASNLNIDNWLLYNTPEGIFISSVSRISDTSVELTLVGNRTKDYDSDITTTTLLILKDEFMAQTSNVLVNSGIIFKAVDDEEIVAISDNGDIFEGSENGKIISVTITGGTFSDNPQASNWIESNLPNGVSIGSIFKVNPTLIEIALVGNRINDYDLNIENFSISINESQIDDYTGANIIVSTGVTFHALVEELTISHSGLTESNLSGSIIDILLINESFMDAYFDFNNFILTNAPAGVEVSYVEYLDANNARLYLYYDGTDFDADITDFNITVLNDEIQGVTDLASNSLIISSIIEDINVTMFENGIFESFENGSIIYVVVKEDYFANILTFSNWELINLPEGVSIASLNRISNDTVAITLSGNRTKDYDENIYNVQLNIASGEFINSLIPVNVSAGIVINANNDSEYLVLSSAGINEGFEDGEIIYVNLFGGTFTSVLTTSNWTLSNLPMGVTIGSINKIDFDSVQIVLSGNTALDYDFDITDVQLTISEQEVDDYNGDVLSAATGVTLIAQNDDEVLTMTDDGLITEGMEFGEQITISLTGGTFINDLQLSNWNIFNAPMGITIGSLLRNSSNSVTLVLSGNSLEDYDSDITNFTLQIHPDEVDDYQGSTFELTNGVTFYANDEQLTINHTGLTELNLNGAIIDLNLAAESFSDETLNNDSFTLNNAPLGLTVGSVSYNSATSASLVLSFDGTDFDVDMTSFTITIEASELNGVGSLTSNSLPISAIAELQTAIISHNGLTEENLNGAMIDFKLKNELFSDAILDANNFTLFGTPVGTTISSVVYANDSLAVITLSFAGYDFDNSFLNFRISVDKSEFIGNSSITSNSLSITATDDEELLSMSYDGSIIEGAEDGEIIVIHLSGGTFTLNPLLENWFFYNLPVGVTVSSLNRIDDRSIAITLSGNSIIDYDQDIINFNIEVNESEVDDYIGVPININTGVVFTAIIEPVEKILYISDGGLFEPSLNGAVLDAYITGDYLKDNILDIQNLKLINAPLGLTIGAITILDSVAFKLVLAFDGSDFDADINNFQIELLGTEMNSDLNLTSNNLYINAHIESQQIFIADQGLTEENLNNATIQLALIGDTFYDFTLDISNFRLENAPGTTLITAVSYLNDTAAIVTLGFNGTDYDTDITNFGIGVFGIEFMSGISIRSNDVTIMAIDDEEIFQLSYDGLITERSEDSEIIKLTLTGGTFIENPEFAFWIFENLPIGVSVGNIQRINANEVEIHLMGNSTVDYDTNLTQFSVLVNATDFDDYNGPPVLVKGGVVFTAISENSYLTIESIDLNESNLNGAEITMMLKEAVFDIVQNGNTTGVYLNNAIDGLAVADYFIENDTTAKAILSYTGIDFDTDLLEFSISLDPTMLIPQVPLTSNNLLIKASIEPSVTINYDGQILEGAEDGELISITLSEGSFLESILINDIILSDLPEGVTLGNLNYISNTSITMSLLGNRVVDYDMDISGVSSIINKSIFANYLGENVFVATEILFEAYNESLLISHEGLTEANLNGAKIDLVLNEDSFVDENLLLENFILYNEPQGVSIDQISYVSNNQAIITLSFDGTDFTANIDNFQIEVNQIELYGVENLMSNNLSITEGVGISDGTSMDLKIYSNFDNVYVTLSSLPEYWNSATITIYDSKGTRIYNSDLVYDKENRITLKARTGYYLVLVKINDREFVKKVFIIPE